MSSKPDLNPDNYLCHLIVDAFLKEHRKSAGGYAPVTEKDLEQLQQLFDQLQQHKFERDPDGDFPLRFLVIDRTKYEAFHYAPVPHLEHKDSGVEFISKARQRVLSLNLALAAGAIDHMFKLTQSEFWKFED